jgi:hypothetical protein
LQKTPLWRGLPSSQLRTKLNLGEIDVLELDELIHRYKRSPARLWNFSGSGDGQWLPAAGNLEYLQELGEEPGWRERGASGRDRSR